MNFEMKLMIIQAVNFLKINKPKFVKLMKHILSIPISEAICEFWGSMIDKKFFPEA